MTVNTTNITSGPYIGNGTSDTYSYTFRVDDKNQISVFETDNLGVETELTVDTDYTVNDIGNDAGGTIVRVAGNLPADYEWYIRANYKYTQLTAFASQGGFFPEVHESAMDKLTFLIQQLLDSVSRAIKLGDSYSGVADPELPEPESEKVIGWNTDGDALENYDNPIQSVTSAAASAAAALVSENNAATSEDNADSAATSSQLIAWEAEAEKMTADSYATEAEGVIVKIYTSDDDGTFTATDTNPAEYSALHHAASAVIKIQLINTASDWEGYSPSDLTIVTKMKGYTTINDNGEGDFIYDSSQARSDANGGTIFDTTVTLANQGTGIGNGCWVRQYSGAVNALWFGDATVDIGVLITSALSVSDSVYVSAGDWTQTTQVDIGSSKTVAMSGMASTTITLTADVVGYRFTKTADPTTAGKLSGFKLTTSGTHTKTGIEIGIDTANFCNRPHLDDIHVDNMGNHGINVVAGIMGTFGHILSTNNGGNGVQLSDFSAGNNAWCFAGVMDVRGNSGSGLVIEGGTGSGDSNCSLAHYGGLIVAQANGVNGVQIQGGQCNLTVYAENNTGDEIALTSISFGNKIHAVNGNTVTDAGTGNLIFDNDIESGRGGFRTQVEIIGSEGLRLNSDAGTFSGDLVINHPAALQHKITASGITDDQDLIFNNSTTKQLRVAVDGMITSLAANVIDAFDGSITLSGNNLTRDRIIKGTPTANRAITVDTAVNIIAVLPDTTVGQSIEFSYINLGSSTATITTNTGVTLVGDAVVAAGTSGKFMIRISSGTTVDIFRTS